MLLGDITVKIQQIIIQELTFTFCKDFECYPRQLKCFSLLNNKRKSSKGTRDSLFSST